MKENREHLTAARIKAEAAAVRLRDWARCIRDFGPDITAWGQPAFIVGELERIAKVCDELGQGFYYEDVAPSVGEPPETAG